MPKYRITDHQSGKTVTVSGEKPPTQAEADSIFSAAGLRAKPQAEPSTGEKVLSGISRVLNIPSNIIAGTTQVAREQGMGTYKSPEIKIPGTNVDIGKYVDVPAITGQLH